MASAGIAIGRRKMFAPTATAKIDWSHPLAAGLAFLDAGGTTFLGTPATVAGTGNSADPVGATKYGPGRRINGSNAYYSATIAGPSSSSTVYTFASVLGASTVAILGSVVYFPTPDVELRVTGTGALSMQGRDGGGYTDASSSGVDVRKGGVLVGMQVPGQVSCWIDGNLAGTATNAGAPGSVSQTASVRLLGRGGGLGWAPGTAALSAVWFRALSADEVAQFSADPFQMLRW